MHKQNKKNKILRYFKSLIACTDNFELTSLDLNVRSSLDSKDTGSQHCWLFQPGSKKATASGGGNKVGQSIKRGSLVTLKIYFRSVTSVMTDIYKYRIITVYDKSYHSFS